MKTTTLRILTLAGIAAALVATFAASAPAWSDGGHGRDRWEGRGHDRYERRHDYRHDVRYDRRYHERGNRGHVVERPVVVHPRTVYVERPVIIEQRVDYPEPAYPPQSVLGGILGSVFGLP